MLKKSMGSSGMEQWINTKVRMFFYAGLVSCRMYVVRKTTHQTLSLTTHVRAVQTWMTAVEIQLLRQMWVHDGENLLVLHEELGGDPSKISVRTRTGQETLILHLPILGNQTLNSSPKSLKFN